MTSLRFAYLVLASRDDDAETEQVKRSGSVTGVRTASFSRLSRYRLALSNRTKHRYKHCVKAVGSFDVLCRQDVRERPRRQQDRTILPAAKAPVGTDERFEGGDVERDLFDAAVDVKVGCLRHHDSAAQHPSCMVAVRPEWIFVDHLTGIEPDAAIRTDRPWHTGRVNAGDEADALVCAETRNELGPSLLQILESEPHSGVDVQHSEVS